MIIKSRDSNQFILRDLQVWTGSPSRESDLAEPDIADLALRNEMTI